jgi:arylsulfatase A-like enzyme
MLCLSMASQLLAAETRPNIIVIVSDDQGYNDLGVQGCKDIATPHIDALARGGIRFTSGYVSGPYCSPTRAGLITGRYQQRFGHEFNPGPAQNASEHMGLPLEEKTLADRLKAAGYATGMVGKWHLGYQDKFHPLKRGFDEFYGFLGGAHSYLDARADAANPILRGTQTVEEQEYLTDAFGREAVAYIDRHKEHPFFLYLTFNAVHTPMHATEKYLARFASIQDERRRTYAAMTAAMDDNIGRVMGRLREAGLQENTLVFYVSDNGGPAANGSNNHPLRGYKAQTLEGGIRVPFFAYWQGRLPAGKTYDQPVIQLDIAATALAAAGIDASSENKLDGVNLLPYLTGEKTQSPHAALYWRFGPQMAIRRGDWKLVRHSGSTETELYNLAKDIGEQNNLAQSEPGKLKELKAAWDEWNSQLREPLWQAPSRRIRAGTAGNPVR